MSIRANAHCHSTYCDGKDAPEAMVLAAIEKDFISLGFSIHGWTPYEPVPVTLDKEAEYRAELMRLREKYAAQIEILIGAERDALYARDFSAYEYLIDSMHWLLRDGVYVGVDYSAEVMEHNVRTLYGGDYYAYCADYFLCEAQLCAETDAKMIGHIDLVSKFNEGNRYFDEEDPRYLRAAFEAIDCAAGRDIPIEINSGAISRGYRSAPYPAPRLLRHMREKNIPIVINSDAHAAADLDAYFPQCVALARACGYRSALRLRASGWEEIALEE